MINFTSMATGFQDRGDENRVERRKTIEMFEDFKKNNPNATLKEFQSFRDQASGGRNYLEAGVGNDATLKSLASQNSARQAREAQSRADARGSSQADFLGKIMPLIQSGLLEMEPQSKDGTDYDYSQARQKIEAMFGGKLPYGVDITNFMTEEARSRAVRNETLNHMDKAKSYLETVTDPTEVDVNQFAKDMNLSLAVARNVLKGAQKKFSDGEMVKQEDAAAAVEAAARQIASDAGIDFNSADLAPSLKARFKNNPYAMQVLEDPNMYTPIQSAIQKSQDRMLLEAETAQITKFNQWGNDETTQRNLINVYTNTANGGDGALREYINKYLNADKRMVAAVKNEHVDTIVQAIISRTSNTLADQWNLQDEKLTSALPEAKAKFFDKNRKATTEYFKTADFANSSAFAQQAAIQLSSKYYMTAEDHNAMANAINNSDELGTVEDYKLLLTDVLDGRAITMDNAFNSATNISNANAGRLQPMTFPEYSKRTTKIVTDARTNTMSLFNSIMSEPLQERVPKLMELKIKYQRQVKALIAQLNAERDAAVGTAGGEYVWLDPKDGGYNIADIKAQVTRLNDFYTTLDQETTRQSEELELLNPTITPPPAAVTANGAVDPLQLSLKNQAIASLTNDDETFLNTTFELTPIASAIRSGAPLVHGATSIYNFVAGRTEADNNRRSEIGKMVEQYKKQFVTALAINPDVRKTLTKDYEAMPSDEFIAKYKPFLIDAANFRP